MTPWEVAQRTAGTLGDLYVPLLMTGECDTSDGGGSVDGPPAIVWARAGRRGVWVAPDWDARDHRPPCATWADLRHALEDRVGRDASQAEWDAEMSARRIHDALVDHDAYWSARLTRAQREDRDRALAAWMIAHHAAWVALTAAIRAAATPADDHGTPSLLDLLETT